MSENVYRILAVSIFFGWIPLLALGHAISSIIRAYRHTTDISVDSIEVYTDKIESLDEAIIDKIILNNINKNGDVN